LEDALSARVKQGYGAAIVWPFFCCAQDGAADGSTPILQRFFRIGYADVQAYELVLVPEDFLQGGRLLFWLCRRIVPFAKEFFPTEHL